MVDPLSIQTIVGLLTPISLTIGVLYYIIDLRNSKKAEQLALETRQAQLFMQIWQQYNSVEYAMQRYTVYEMNWDDMDDYERKYPNVPSEDRYPSACEVSIGRTFEGLSLLLQDNLINKEWLYQLYCGDIIRWWEKFDSLIKEMMERGYSHPWSSVEPLYREMKEMRESRKLGKLLGRPKKNSNP